MKFALINASNPVNLHLEADEYVDYRDGLDKCFDGNEIVKKCHSWHSLPAAFESEFFVYNKPMWPGILQYDNIVVLVNRDLEKVVPLIKKLKVAKKKVLVGFHESSDDFFQQASPYHNQEQPWLKKLKELVDMSDGFCNVMNTYNEWFEWYFQKPVLTTRHAAPYTEFKHDFVVPFKEREGIMLGTRTLNQRLRRNTLQGIGIALQVAKELDTFVTWVSEESFKDLEQFSEYFAIDCSRLKLVKGPLSYENWLKTIAGHKVLFHYDFSCTLGQLVVDAALVDVPCVGGNSDNNFLGGTKTEYQPHSANYWLKKYYSLQESLPKKQIEIIKRSTSFEYVKDNIERFFEELK